MDSKADRLRKARIAAGFDVASKAAERFHWKASTYLAHENGSRGYDEKSATEYGRAFKVAPEWLLFGHGEMKPPVAMELNEAPVPFDYGSGVKVAGLPTIRYFDLAPAATDPAVYVAGARPLAAFGIMPGDVLVIDRDRRPEAGDLVVATLTDPGTGERETVIRRLIDGLLLDADPTTAHPAIAATAEEVAIVGPVVASVRHARRDS